MREMAVATSEVKLHHCELLGVLEDWSKVLELQLCAGTRCAIQATPGSSVFFCEISEEKSGPSK